MARRNIRPFVLRVAGIVVLCHVPLALGLREILRAHEAPLPSLLVFLIIAGLLALLPGRLALLQEDRPISLVRSLFLDEPYYVHLCAAMGSFLFFVPLAILTLPFRLAGAEFVPSIGMLGFWTYAVSFALSFYGVFIRRRLVRVREIDVDVAHLPKAFEGYRIAHLSDLHIGAFTPKSRADRWADRVNEEAVDLVALTGDYVTSGVAFHDDIAQATGRMRASDGVIAVMGNHDYFGEGEPLITKMRAAGMKVLVNERTSITKEGETIDVAGVDDIWTRRTDIEKTLAGRDESRFLLVLAHDPKLFPEFVRKKADLILSGHTHWGQVAVPFLAHLFNPSRLAYRYHADFVREDTSVMYISPGLGTTGPPIRFGASPEIAILRLRRAA